MSNVSDCHLDQLSALDIAVCRDFLRNVCKRGRRCRFFHPPQAECEKIRRSERTFCHDYQNSVCRRPACKFLHYSREDEEIFRRTGHLPNETDQTTFGSTSISAEEQPPTCKDHVNGICGRGSACKYRHIPNTSERKTICCITAKNQTTFRGERFKEEPTMTEFGSVMCSVPQSAPIHPSAMGLTGSVSLPHSAMLALPTAISSADRIHLHQPAPVNANVVSPQDSLLTPVKDVYLSNGTSNAPIVGVVDHVGLPASNVQHTLYAHHSNLSAFAPLVSVSTAKPVPCSSVLAVVAEPSQHTTVLQHPAAVATSQTTYHLVPNNATPLQQHLLSSASSVSTAPTLLTIPVPQFACNNTTGAMLASHSNVECNTHQHPAVLTSVLPTNQTLSNTPASGFSSFNLLQITPSTAVENVSVFTGHHAVPEVTTSVSSSTTAVLAAAAAAGYLAQHLPVMTGSSTATTPCSGVANTPDNAHGGRVNFLRGSHKDRAVDGVHDSDTLAGIPAVSAAAAAVVAAAQALVARTKTVPGEQTAFATGRLQSEDVATGNETKVPPYSQIHATSRPNTSVSAACTSASITSTTSTPVCLYPVSSSGNTLTHGQSANAHFTHSSQQDEENAKTAAAVAAAACIGAMFSQPLGNGHSNSSSVAAMLGDLINHRQSNRMSQSSNQSSCGYELSEVCRLTQHPSTDTPCSHLEDDHSRNISDSFDKPQSNDVNRIAAASKHSYFSDPFTIDKNDLSDEKSVSRRFDDQSVVGSTFQGHSCPHSHIGYSKTSTWTSVATTVASAAQAAAAAAVAATAAVTHSAKFFQLARKQNSSQSSVMPNSDLATESDYSCRVETAQHNGTDAPVTCSLMTTSVSDRTTLSPNTAVTMTSAAAAAAMAAAAASAAAKRRILSDTRNSIYTGNFGRTYSNQPRLSRSVNDFYDVGDSLYSNVRNNRFGATKRRTKVRSSGTTKKYGYVRFRRDATALRNTLDDDDEDDPDVFEDDVDVDISMSLSPAATPPYDIPIKLTKHSLDIVYDDRTDDSRPVSCDTSPSEICETESYSLHRHLPPGSPIHHSGESVRGHVDTTIPHMEITRCDDSVFVPTGIVSSGYSTRTKKPISSAIQFHGQNPDLSHPQSCSKLYTSLRRCHSTSSVFDPSLNKLTTLFRSSSLPMLFSENSFRSPASFPCHLLTERSQQLNGLPSVTTDTSLSSKPSPEYRSIDDTPSGHLHVTSAEYGSGKGSNVMPSRQSHKNEYDSSLPLRSYRAQNVRTIRARNNISNSLIRSAGAVCRQATKYLSNRRLKPTASPDSMLTEDYSGHDDVDDPEYMDTEDDVFGIHASEHVNKLPISSGARQSRLRKRKPDSDPFASGNFSTMTFQSASLRHQHALKAENARLRRKLTDLMRQRGDLRAANEILLEQNARLRHSSKRVSAVARMAESATKIIEAHKSQFVQPVSQPITGTMYHPPGTQVSHSANPFSLSHAAAAVVAAAQQSNTPALRGVYVSSPTASITQQTPHAGATHTIFPSAVVASAVPGAIALSSHQSLAAMQLQTPTDSLVPTSVPTRQHVEQTTIPAYYQHQLQHSMGSIPASIGNISSHPNIVPVSSTLQVCHYSIPSSGAVFPSLPQPTAVSPSMVPVGAPSALTLLVGQPSSAYASVGSHLPPTLHLQSSVKTDTGAVKLTPVSQIPYLYHNSSPAAVQCSPLVKPDPYVISDTSSVSSQHSVGRRGTRSYLH